MAHFAELDVFKKVVRILVVDDKDTQDAEGNEVEEIGAKYLREAFGGTWIQTSFNKKIRKNSAGIGFTYDEVKDAFIPPKPFPSWVLDAVSCLWEAPTTKPDDGESYRWNEDTKTWDLKE